jgi:hypothetical protein
MSGQDVDNVNTHQAGDQTASSSFRFPRLTGWHVAAAALLAIVFVFLSNSAVWHTDVWGHLRFGEYIVREQRLPEHEMFSGDYADQEQPYLNFQWLAQAASYLVYETGARWAGGDAERQLAGGALALATEHAVAAVLRLLILLLVFQRLTGSPSMALLGVVLTLIFSLEHVLVHRPQMFGEICLALLFLPLSQPSLSRRALLFIPLVMVLWANCHGSFPMGFVVLGAFTAGRVIDLLVGKSEIRSPKSETTSEEPGFGFRIWNSLRDTQLRRLLLAMALSLVAVVALNPHGVRVFAYVAAMSNHENIRTMEEWKQLPVKSLAGYLFLASILMMAALARLSPRRFTAAQILLLVGLGVQVLAHWRVMVWWGFVVVWVALPHIQALLTRGRKVAAARLSLDMTALTLVVALAGLLLSGPALWAAGFRREANRHVTDKTAWRVADFLREQYAADPKLSRCVFTSETTGDYLFWNLRLDPPVRIFCYTHVHLLTEKHWKECMQDKFAEPSWEAILEREHVQFLVVENMALYKHLMEAVQAAGDRWEVVSEDPLFVAKSRF